MAKLGRGGVERSIDSVVQAARENDVRQLVLLQRAGQDFEGRDEYGETALVAALRWGAGDAREFLLKSGVDVSAADASGRVPMAHAYLREDWAAARQLARYGAKVEVELEDGEDALETAVRLGYEPLVAFIRANGDGDIEAAVPVDEREVVKLVTAGDELRLKKALGEAEELANARDHRGTPILVLAARGGQGGVVDRLLESGAEVNAVGEGGGTALMAALARDDLEMVGVLLDAGARLSLDGPAAYALVLSWHEQGREELLGGLFDAGLSFEGVGKWGDRLMAIAIGERDEELAAKLLDHGVRAEDWFREVLGTEDPALVREWVGRDVDVDEVEEAGGETALARFVREGKAPLAKVMVRAGADVNVETEDGQTVLAWAIAHGNKGMVRALLKAGADANVTIATPVSDAFLTHFEDEKTTSYYLERDARLTPLMIAAGSGQEDAVVALLESGAKTGVYTSRYKVYPINFATRRHDVNLIQRMLGRDPDPSKQERKVVVDLSTQRATLYLNGQVHMTSRVSTGKKGYTTPTGEYVITNKHRHWTSNLYDASMPYFMRLNCGAFGLHQSNSVPSYPASHGCIRMPWKDAKAFFGVCEVGDRVTIQP
ncbi:MAG: ankyrin repeat domain-containing protein [Verrucomicrobiota bacterium]